MLWICLQFWLKFITSRVRQKTTTLNLSDEAMQIYRIAHDENVDYREKEVFKEELLSIKSKSLGHLLRVAGVINRLREANTKCLD